MIKDVGGKFDDYSTSPKIRQILLHWGYELKIRFVIIFSHQIFLFFYCIKGELLSIQERRNIAKSKKKYSKEKAAEYYLLNKVAIKKKRQNKGPKI